MQDELGAKKDTNHIWLALLFRAGNRLPGVFDIDANLVVKAMRHEGNGAVGRGRVYRVEDKIHQGLLQLVLNAVRNGLRLR